MLLYIVEKFPSKTEHFITNEISGLHQDGVRLIIVALKKETSTPNTQHLPVVYIKNFEVLLQAIKCMLRWPVFRYSESGSIRSFLHQLKVVAIAKVVKSKMKLVDIRHVHAHFAFIPTEIAQFLSKELGTDFSFTAHAKDLYVNDAKKLHAYIDQAKFVITCTQFGKTYLQKISPLNKNIHCIHHGISMENWPFQEVKRIATGHIKLLYVGRLVEKKGIHLLIEAIHHLKSSGIPVECTFAGSGPLAKKLAATAKELDLSNQVRFIGYVSHKDLRSYYQTHDLLVCPSVQARNMDMDGMPNVMLEAMAIGVPVIASDLSGIPEIITHRETGMLFQSGNVEGIVQHIKTLYADPKLYDQIRKAARKQLEEEFDLNVSNKKIEVILKTAMAS